MPTVTVRPNSAVSVDAIAFGAANIVVALNDSSDSSYGEHQANSYKTLLGIATPSIPGGGMIISATPKMRVAGNGAPGTIQILGPGFSVLAAVAFALHSASPTVSPNIYTIAAPASVSPYTQLGWKRGDIGGSYSWCYDIWQDVLYATQPSVAVSAPTGTITNSSQPPLGWAHTAGTDGGAQAWHEEKVFSAAQYGAGGFSPDTSTPTWTSGVVAGSAASSTPAILPNATYRAYVRTAQNINGAQHWSAWSFSGFTVNVTGPTVSSVAVAVVTGGLQVTVNRNTGGTAWDYVDVERSIAGGPFIWVRDAVLAPVSGNTFVIVDYEVPFAFAAAYRARGVRVVSGQNIAGAYVTAGTTPQWASTLVWWKDPLNPALNVRLETRRKPQPTRGIRQGVHRPLGAVFPVVISDRRQAIAGEFIVKTSTDAEWAAFEALLDSNVLLVQTRAAWRVGTNGTLYVVAGQVEELDIDESTVHPHRFWRVPFNEVARPPAEA